MVRRKSLTVLLIFFSALIALNTLAGCAVKELNEKGKKIEKGEIRKITPGETQGDEIIGAFGKPQKVIKRGNREEWYYEHSVKETPTYFGGFFIYERGAKEKASTLKVIIKNGVVESYHFETKEEK